VVYVSLQSNVSGLQREVDMLKLELSQKDREISTLQGSAQEMESLVSKKQINVRSVLVM